MEARIMNAKYVGKCACCAKGTSDRSRGINIGTEIAHLARGVVMHAECYQAATTAADTYAAAVMARPYGSDESKAAVIGDHAALVASFAALAEEIEERAA